MELAVLEYWSHEKSFPDTPPADLAVVIAGVLEILKHAQPHWEVARPLHHTVACPRYRQIHEHLTELWKDKRGTRQKVRAHK